MSVKYYDTNSLTNIANSIRAQANTNNLMTVEQMPLYIENIQTGGSLRHVSFAGFKGTDIPLEDIDFDINKLYNFGGVGLFYNCGNLVNIPSSINVYKFKDLSRAFYNMDSLSLNKVTGTYPYLEKAVDFCFYNIRNIKNDCNIGGRLNVIFNLPNVKDLTHFLNINSSSMQAGGNWIINIYAPKAEIYDKSIAFCYVGSGYSYINNTNPQWNMYLTMPNLTKFSNFFYGMWFNKGSSATWTRLYGILNSITRNVIDGSYMFANFKTGANGYLPNLNLSKVTNARCMFYSCSPENSSVATRYTTNLNRLDFSRIEDGDMMFKSSSIPSYYSPFSLNMPNCTTAVDMFSGGGPSYSSVNIGSSSPNLDLPNCANIAYIYYSQNNLISITQSNLPNIENAAKFCSRCGNLTTIPENFIGTDKITNIDGMFAYCNNLTTASLVNIAKWMLSLNTQNIEDFSYYKNVKAYTNTYNYDETHKEYIYRLGILAYCSKQLNTTTIGSELVTQLTSNGWILS